MISAQRLRDKHKGKLFIITGSGPSLDDYTQKDIPEDAILMCLNNSIKKFEKCDYWMAVDANIMGCEVFIERYYRRAKHIILTEEFFRIRGNVNLYNYFGLKYSEYTPLERDGDLWEMNRESKKLSMGYNVMVSAIHLAMIMGASKIALLGGELSLDKGRRYFKESEYIEYVDSEADMLFMQSAWNKINTKALEGIVFNCATNSKMNGVSIKSLKQVICEQ